MATIAGGHETPASSMSGVAVDHVERLQLLPSHLVGQIFSFCSERELMALGATCRRLRQETTRLDVWLRLWVDEVAWGLKGVLANASDRGGSNGGELQSNLVLWEGTPPLETNIPGTSESYYGLDNPFTPPVVIPLLAIHSLCSVQDFEWMSLLDGSSDEDSCLDPRSDAEDARIVYNIVKALEVTRRSHPRSESAWCLMHPIEFTHVTYNASCSGLPSPRSCFHKRVYRSFQSFWSWMRGGVVTAGEKSDTSDASSSAVDAGSSGPPSLFEWVHVYSPAKRLEVFQSVNQTYRWDWSEEPDDYSLLSAVAWAIPPGAGVLFPVAAPPLSRSPSSDAVALARQLHCRIMMDTNSTEEGRLRGASSSWGHLLYHPSHVSLYLALLRYTFITCLQVGRSATESRCMVKSVIISPICATPLQLLFFMRHRHEGCPLVHVRLAIIRYLSDDDDDEVEEVEQVLEGGMGRVEVDVPPTVSAEALETVQERLCLPVGFPKALVWNVLVYAAGYMVQAWDQFGMSFATTYNRTFTDAFEACIAQTK